MSEESATDPKEGQSDPSRLAREIRWAVLITLAFAGLGLVMAAYGFFTTANLDHLHILFHLFFKQDGIGSLLTIVVLIAALAVGRRPWKPFERLLELATDHPIGVAAVALAALALAAVFIYHDHPLSMDEYAPHFQAKVFATGHLAGQFPTPLMGWLVPEGFIGIFFLASRETGEIISAYWPGFALMLTPFMKAGIPWFLNPLLSAATLLILWHIGRELLRERAMAGWVVLMTLASPVFAVTGISYYSMTGHLFLNLVFSALLLNPVGWRPVLAGLIGSLALVLHNPVPHVFYAIPWILWLVSRSDRLRTIWRLALGYFPLTVLLGLAWSWYRTGFRWSQIVPIEAGASVGSLITVALGYISKVFRFPTVNVLYLRLFDTTRLFVWAVPLLVVLAVLGYLHRRNDIRIQLFAASALTTMLGYLMVPYTQGHGWGFRYFHSAWGVLPLLAAAAIEAHPPQLSPLRRIMGVAIVLSLLLGNGLRFQQVESFMRRHLDQRPAAVADRDQICIIDPFSGFYSIDLVQNDPFLRDRVIYFLSHGPEIDQALMTAAFPKFHRHHAGDPRVWLRESNDGQPPTNATPTP